MVVCLWYQTITVLVFHYIFPRERPSDAEEESLTCSPLQPRGSSLSLGEKQEDADNQKNSTRASQAALNSNAIHIPVTITAPPGETTIISSMYSHIFILLFSEAWEQNYLSSTIGIANCSKKQLKGKLCKKKKTMFFSVFLFFHVLCEPQVFIVETTACWLHNMTKHHIAVMLTLDPTTTILLVK